jgi:hypothetical protein
MTEEYEAVNSCVPVFRLPCVPRFRGSARLSQ